MAVFIPFTAPGDRIEAVLVEKRDRFARAKLIRILEPGPGRIIPPCPYHFRTAVEGTPEQTLHAPRFALHTPPPFCGGCSLQHLTYDQQLKNKRALVQETLERLGGLKGIDVRPVLGMKDPWRYRNKVQQPVGWSPSRKQLISGFYQAGSHAILPIDDCLIQSDLSVKLVNRAKALLGQYKIPAYDEARHSGWIRHLLVRTNSAGQALLVFVTRTPEFFKEREIVTTLLNEFPALIGVHQNVQPARSNVILGRTWRSIAGANFMEEQLGALRFRLSAGSFFQVNTAQAQVLYDTVKTMAGSGRRLLDLYTGVGTIALWLAERFSEVAGIEENPTAIEDAEANAELNGIENARFLAEPTENFLRELDPHAGGKELTIVVDPPRAGCEPQVLDAITQLRPGRMVYVSCDPATLARDLKFLTQQGYRLEDIQPVDLFPHTPHIETAVKLSI